MLHCQSQTTACRETTNCKTAFMRIQSKFSFVAAVYKFFPTSIVAVTYAHMVYRPTCFTRITQRTAATRSSDWHFHVHHRDKLVPDSSHWLTVSSAVCLCCTDTWRAAYWWQFCQLRKVWNTKLTDLCSVNDYCRREARWAHNSSTEYISIRAKQTYCYRLQHNKP